MDRTWNQKVSKILFSRTVGSLYHPPAEVQIKVDEAIQSITDATMDYLKYQGILLKDHDTETFRKVLTVQVQTKVALARENSPFPFDIELCDVVHRRAKLFNMALKSTAVFLDQIGEFKLDNQRFYPKLRSPVAIDTANKPDDTWQKTNISFVRDGIQEDLYVKAVDGQFPSTSEEIMAVPPERRRWYHDTSVNEVELVGRYIDLISRIRQKVSQALTNVQFEPSSGTPAQLVGCRDAPRYAAERDA